MAKKEKKQISVLSIPLLHAEPWQMDDILNRMEIERKIYNTALSKLLKKMHVMERTKEWRENEANIEEIYEKYKDDAKKRKEELKPYFDKKAEILKKNGFTEYGIDPVVAGCNFSPENIPSKTASISIAKPLWAAFSSRFYPKKLTKRGNLPEPSFKRFSDSEYISFSTDGKSGMRLREEDGKLKLIIANNRYKKRKIIIPIEYSDLNVYEKEALSNPIKILTLQAKKVRNKHILTLNVSYEGLPPIKYTKNGELKHVWNKKGEVGIAVWGNTLCAVSDSEVYIASLTPPDHERNELIIAGINQKCDKLRRLRDFQNYDENGEIRKGIIAADGRRHKLKWHNSKNTKALYSKMKDIYRVEREQKELIQWNVVNHLLGMGDSFIVAETSFSTQKPEFDEDDRLTNAEYRKKKKKRKTIMAAAPYSLLSKLNNRSVSIFERELKKIDVPESEYWYNHTYNCSREESLSSQYVVIEGYQILQTAYRAFLITHRKNGKYDLKSIQKDFPEFIKHYQSVI